MDTTTVSNILPHGHAQCVAWTSGSELAVGHDLGCAVILDAGTTKIQRSFYPMKITQQLRDDGKLYPVTAINWGKDRGLLAVGQANGVVTYFDPRTDHPVRADYSDSAHSILGIQWSPDGMYLASGFKSGVVRCTDWRANKSFDLKSPQTKTAHRNAVKV
jgi:WD40 repeat protein